MTEPEGPELTLEKLVGVYRVLIPHKIAAYTYHLNNTSTITDAPTIRSLRLVLNDELEDFEYYGIWWDAALSGSFLARDREAAR